MGPLEIPNKQHKQLCHVVASRNQTWHHGIMASWHWNIMAMKSEDLPAKHTKSY
jgi:hypothetical protein